MGIFILWIIFCIIIGIVGRNRKIGFTGAFFVSLLLSPIIGLIITLISKSKVTVEDKMQISRSRNQQAELLLSIQKERLENNTSNISNQLINLLKLKEKGQITESEYIKARKQILDSI